MLRKQWQTVVLKLIRRQLSVEEKQRVQKRLQKVYSANGKGFYVYVPKQKGKIKEQLAYIRRPALALHRIKEYNGQYVLFSYIDKKDGLERQKN